MKLSEQDRFWTYVVKGPEPDDCWLWIGAISDDGYGRFWITRDGVQKAVRPQRYAYALATGETLAPDILLLHECDVPICVHAETDPASSHVYTGTHRENMIDRRQKHRDTNGSNSLHWRGIARKVRVQRSRDLRDVVREYGWDRERISATLSGVEYDHPTLF